MNVKSDAKKNTSRDKRSSAFSRSRKKRKLGREKRKSANAEKKLNALLSWRKLPKSNVRGKLLPKRERSVRERKLYKLGFKRNQESLFLLRFESLGRAARN
jgi:hypothetical protein